MSAELATETGHVESVQVGYGAKPRKKLLVPRAGLEPARPFSEATDFKSVVSTNFTTEGKAFSLPRQIKAFTAKIE